MANGHIEIHDPFSNHDVRTSRTRCGSTDADDLRDMPEFRLMMAFARRRRTQERTKRVCEVGNSTHSDETPQTPQTPQTPATTREDVKRKKSKSSVKKTWKTLISCFKPTIEISEETPGDTSTMARRLRGAGEEEKEEEDEEEEEEMLEEAAKMLTKMADEIPFTPPELEADSPGDDAHIERLIGLLLREHGDQINERELREGLRATEAFWNYPFFERLMVALLTRMGLWTDPEAPGPQTSPQTQIALTCEVASRLSAADTLPMNRLLGYGATYLQNHFSSWVTQQGGYEVAFNSDDEEEDDVQ